MIYQKNDSLVILSRSSARYFSRLNSGFTLTELMVVLSIAAILMAIGVPSYINFITVSNISAESTALMGDLQYARSQAIKQGYPVSICAANTSGTVGSYACNGTTTSWKNGWITYTGNTKEVITATKVLRVQLPLTSTDTITSGSAAPVYKWCFNNFGFPTINYSAVADSCGPPTDKGSVTISPVSGTVTSQTVCISAVGSMQSVAGGNSKCP